MAITMDDLKKLLDDGKLNYYLDPKRDAVLLGFGGLNGRFQITISIQVDGRFLQFRSMGYASCPPDHPHLAAVHRLLLELAYTLRLVKFSWDPRDGEIAAFADIWLMDAKLTPEQFQRMLQNFIPALDTSFPRIRQTLESGKDPGPEDPAALAAKIKGDTGSLPEPMRKLVEKLRGPTKGAPPDTKPKQVPEIGEL